VGVVLGNEGLFWKRYSTSDISAAADYVRARSPQLALGSSEPFALYLDSPDADALLALDMLLPNLHPRFESWFDPANLDQSVDFVAEVLEKLRARTGKPILVKETGLPSGPEDQGFTEQRQADFWLRLMARVKPGPLQNIAGFEAFDAPWKPRELEDEFGRLEPSEAHWGMFRQDGSPKPVVQRLGRWPAPAPAAAGESR
jgi:exo-beta-1,3-glucanase (GH17 family)